MAKVGIAFGAPFTGDQNVVGIPMFQIHEYANELLKGNHDVEMVGVDDRAEFDQAKIAATQVVDDPDILAVIHKNSDCILAAGPAYDEAGIPLFTSSSTNYSLAHQGWKNFRRFCANDMLQARVPAKYAIDELGMKRFVVVYDNTSFGEPLGKEFKDYAESLGAEVVKYVEIPVGKKEYKDTIEMLKEANAEAIFFALTEIEGALLAKEIYQNKLPIKIFAADAVPSSLIVMAGADEMEGHYITYVGLEIEKGSEAYELLKGYEEKYQTPIPVFSAEIYDILSYIHKAVDRLEEPTREAMAKALSEVEPFEGLTGEVSFDAFGEKKSAKVTLWQITDGKTQKVKVYTREDVGIE
jgi:branched-chain amino acid transport system substrate-binding protein